MPYLDLFVFWLACILFVVLLLVVARLLANKSDTKQKLSSYECGFEPFSDARGKQDILFYIVAILFILFDIELVFLVPWALANSHLSVEASFSIFFFILVLVIGLLYEIKNKALNLNKKKK